MWLLVRDGIRRWWWVFGLFTLGLLFAVFNRRAAASGGMVTAALIVYGGIMVQFCELLSVGKFRVIAALPLGARQQGLGSQALFAWTFPLLALLAYALEALAHVAWPDQVPVPGPFLRYLATITLATGINCVFIQAVFPSIRYTEGWKKALRELAGGLSALGVLIIAGFLIWRVGLDRAPDPVSPQDPFALMVSLAIRLAGPRPHLFDPINCAALAVAVAAIVGTALRARTSGRSLALLATRRPDPGLSVFACFTKRTFGFLEPWSIELQATMGFIAILCSTAGLLGLALSVVTGLDLLRDVFPGTCLASLVVVANLVCLIPVVPWLLSVRTLRMLPFSRKRLALYLVSFPVLAFACYALVLFAPTLYSNGPNSAFAEGWLLVLVFGLALQANCVFLTSRSPLLCAAFLVLPSIVAAIALLPHEGLSQRLGHVSFALKLLIAIGLAVWGYLSTRWAIRRSSPYRPRVLPDLT